ncbi:MAG: lysoplasmalogenase [Clostridia bacterium]|nr:lysoplasmalogenase [Clostridia bacterium]
MLVPVVFTVIGLIFLAIFLHERVKVSNARSTILKAMTSACFMGIAFSGYVGLQIPANKSVFVALTMAGLLFGLMGDIWLDCKYAHPQSGITYTYAGFVCFAIGHIFFDLALIAGFYTRGHILYIVIPAVISVLASIFIAFSEKLLRVTYGLFKPIVIVYSALLISLMAFSFGFVLMYNFRNFVLIVFNIGSVFFTVSDFILNGTYFGSGKNRSIDVITNHISYYTAQFLIAFSICLLRF